MKAGNIADRVYSKVDEFFDEISKSSVKVTIGIGDGGNEIRMGKIFSKILKFIKNGEKCITSPRQIY